MSQYVYKVAPWNSYVGKLISDNNGVWKVKTFYNEFVYETMIGAEIMELCPKVFRSISFAWLSRK